MNSRHLVDPQLFALLEVFPTMQFSAELLPEIRAHTWPATVDPHAAAAVAMESRLVSGPSGAPMFRCSSIGRMRKPALCRASFIYMAAATSREPPP
jgi:hypothetical protein